MDFQLTEEQKLFKQSVHDFADSRIAPMVDYWEKGDLSLARKDLIAEYRELGLLGITLPEEYGGQGLPAIYAILAMEELARVTTRASGVVMESSFGPIRAVEKFGTEEQKQRFIPPCARGEKFMSVGMTEPGAGSALTDLTTRAVLKGDHYVVNGQKRFISGGGHSDWYMVYVRLSDRKGHKGIGGIVAEKGSPGFSFGKQEEFMGLHGMHSCDLIFEDCLIPKENLIIPEGGFAKLMQAFDVERCGNATQSLGIAWGALEAAKKYSKERMAFGKPICEFQAIQLLLADMAMKVEAARLLIYRAVVNAGNGLPSVFESSVAKCFANEIGKEVTDMAMQVFGGYGYSKEYPIERMLRDSRGWPLAGGTVQIQRINIASAMLGRRFDQR